MVSVSRQHDLELFEQEFLIRLNSIAGTDQIFGEGELSNLVGLLSDLSLHLSDLSPQLYPSANPFPRSGDGLTEAVDGQSSARAGNDAPQGLCRSL